MLIPDTSLRATAARILTAAGSAPAEAGIVADHLVEANLRGTHRGPFRGLPPTGRSFEMRFCAIFVFEEERLVCERVYFDANTILRQLGIARDPLTLGGRVLTVLNHPLTVGRAVARQISGR